MNELLPCPFCANNKIDFYDLNSNQFIIICEKCCCKMESCFEDVSVIIKKWNSRNTNIDSFCNNSEINQSEIRPHWKNLKYNEMTLAEKVLACEKIIERYLKLLRK